jgi:hypothetical protein
MMHATVENNKFRESNVLKIDELSKEQLIGLLQDTAKNWLAHDGFWFLAAEQKFDLETAIELDKEAWRGFAVVEAKRILKRLNMAPGGGIAALVKAFDYRMYAFINTYESKIITPNRCIFKMKSCHVQDARKRKNLPDFPCKPVGIIEFSQFASTIDPRIETTCIACPPDRHPDDEWCNWEFSIKE